MNMQDIILKKRYGNALSDDDIDFFIKGVVDKSIPDYQISALLMAIVLNGMNDHEMTELTIKMAESGRQNDLSYINGIPVDKHSTGGVGDKCTPLVMPLVATFGVSTVKLSGRGLGFTGGTVDKFESIEGFNVEVPMSEFPELIKKCNMAISGQTPDLAPADKVLYSLRDVTGTIDSIPLIASSIMSKKIAGGAHGIVLDVTCGHGAFMKNKEEAIKLSEAMIRIGKLAGREVVAVITDMNQPLGRNVGNVIEMQEVFEILSGKHISDVEDVVCALAANMVMLAGKNDSMSMDELFAECKLRLTDGRALEKYKELILSQGGHINSNGSPVYVDYPNECMRISASQDGYISAIKADMIGKASVALGAGRKVKTDEIDYGAGIGFYVKVGDYVKRGDALCALYLGGNHADEDDRLFEATEIISEAYEYSDVKPDITPSVIEVLK